MSPGRRSLATLAIAAGLVGGCSTTRPPADVSRIRPPAEAQLEPGEVVAAIDPALLDAVVELGRAVDDVSRAAPEGRGDAIRLALRWLGIAMSHAPGTRASLPAWDATRALESEAPWREAAARERGWPRAAAASLLVAGDGLRALAAEAYAASPRVLAAVRDLDRALLPLRAETVAEPSEAAVIAALGAAADVIDAIYVALAR